MSVFASNLLAGTNSYATPPEHVGFDLRESTHPGILSGLAVEAQGSPNATVKVNAGSCIVRATPTGEAERLFKVTLSADTNVTIAANSSGSTKYDLVYIKLDADDLHNPPADGNLTEASSILTERHDNSGEELNDTNGLVLAEVTVANGFSSIANTAINLIGRRALDQWIDSADTATYASATTFTVKGNYTNLINALDPIYIFQQSTWKYFRCMQTSYSQSTQLTTVTVRGASGVEVTNNTITRWGFSKSWSPNGITGANLTSSLIGGPVYRTSDFSTSNTTATQVTDLSVTVIVPAGGRPVEVQLDSPLIYNTTTNYAEVSLWRGTVGSGTLLGLWAHRSALANYGAGCSLARIDTPSAGSVTYNVGLRAIGGGTATLAGSFSGGAEFKVKLL